VVGRSAAGELGREVRRPASFSRAGRQTKLKVTSKLTRPAPARNAVILLPVSLLFSMVHLFVLKALSYQPSAFSKPSWVGSSLKAES
jgi:hypothetical protein